MTSARRVEATYITHDTDLVDVTPRVTTTAAHDAAATKRGAAPAHDEVVHTTANHPWLTADHGWLPASFLHIGEPVVRANGTTATVAAIRAVPGTARMWDLTVGDLHDFAVGAGAYVVHNCDFKTFNARNRGVFEGDDEARATYNTINRARNGDRSLWPDADGKPWDNSTEGAIERGTGRRPPLPGKPENYTEWTVHYGDTEPGNNAGRLFRRVLMGDDGSFWFTRYHTTGFRRLWYR